MPVDVNERIELGRRLVVAAPRLRERLAALHAWLPQAAAKTRDPQIAAVVEDGKVVALDATFGRLLVSEEFAIREGRLVARVAFYQPADAMHRDPRRIYAIELREDHMAYFDPPVPENEFSWAHAEDTWAPGRNVYRLGYELAIACMQP